MPPLPAPCKQKLFSIHGINDSARWQDDIGKVFAAEFEHVPLRYREYHLFGAIKMFLWPWSLLASALVVAVVNQLYGLESVGITVLIFAVLFAWYEWAWSGWTGWLVAPLLIVALSVFVYLRLETNRLTAMWLLFAALVFLQELRELQCDEGPRYGWWPVMAGLTIAAGLLPIYWNAWYWVLTYIAACVVVAYLEAGRRRNQALAKVSSRYKENIGQGSTAHWAAHSFGTYLTCRLLTEQATFMRLDHVVLCGAVAPESFDWQVPLAIGTYQSRLVARVRNEHGHKDWAVPLATLISAWGRINGYGRSGVDGFQSPYVHNVVGAFGGCMLCAARTRSLAHNVSIADYAHGSFLKPIHFRQLWLPFFWDFVPMDYEEFLQLCNTVAQNTDDDFHFGLALDEQSLDSC